MSDSVRQLNANSIVESGENDNGYYRKWANGTLEMWGRKRAEVWIQNGNSAPYYSNVIDITLPVESITSVVSNVYVESSGIIWATGAAYSNKSSVGFRMAANASVSDLGVVYNWHVIGTWK